MPGVAQPVYRTGAYVAGGVGIGAGNRRHQPKKRHLVDTIKGITKPDIRRLARRGGVRRIKSDIYETTRAVIWDRIWKILHRIYWTMNNAGPGKGSEKLNGRKVVTSEDVVFALRQMGDTLYGHGWYELGRPVSKKRARAGRA